MQADPAALPCDAEVDVALLVASLRDKTQCYKILLLRALADERASRGGTFVSYADLAVSMAEAAFWPLRLYLLRIGLDDRLTKALDGLGPLDVGSSKTRLRSRLRAVLPDQMSGGFLHYAPQRLLVPWYAARAAPVDGRDDGGLERRIRTRASRCETGSGFPSARTRRRAASTCIPHGGAT